MNDFRKFLSACLEVEKILFTTPAWSSSCAQLVEVDRMEVIRRISLHGVPYNWRREKDCLIVSGEFVCRNVLTGPPPPAKTTEKMRKPWKPGEIPS